VIKNFIRSLQNFESIHLGHHRIFGGLKATGYNLAEICRKRKGKPIRAETQGKPDPAQIWTCSTPEMCWHAPPCGACRYGARHAAGLHAAFGRKSDGPERIPRRRRTRGGAAVVQATGKGGEETESSPRGRSMATAGCNSRSPQSSRPSLAPMHAPRRAQQGKGVYEGGAGTEAAWRLDDVDGAM
jgi:hypothetical protein